MCHHSLELQTDNETLYCIDLGGGLGCPAPWLRDIHALQNLAALYAETHPEQADELKIKQYSCNGWQRTFPALTGEPTTITVASLLDAVLHYADPVLYRTSLNADRQLTSGAFDDNGRTARAVLAAEEDTDLRRPYTDVPDLTRYQPIDDAINHPMIDPWADEDLDPE